MTALPRLKRARHGLTARLVDRQLEPGERVRAVTSGHLSGVGDVLAIATDHRMIVAEPAGWSKSVPFAQITGVDTDRTVGFGLTVTVQAAGTVLALRSPAWSARGFASAVRAGSAPTRNPALILPMT